MKKIFKNQSVEFEKGIEQVIYDLTRVCINNEHSYDEVFDYLKGGWTGIKNERLTEIISLAFKDSLPF